LLHHCPEDLQGLKPVQRPPPNPCNLRRGSRHHGEAGAPVQASARAYPALVGTSAFLIQPFILRPAPAILQSRYIQAHDIFD
jgi:hypothetical protein